MTFGWLAIVPLACLAQTPTMDYYTIRGDTARGLLTQLKRLGPVDDAGKRSDATIAAADDVRRVLDVNRKGRDCPATEATMNAAP